MKTQRCKESSQVYAPDSRFDVRSLARYKVQVGGRIHLVRCSVSLVPQGNVGQRGRGEADGMA